MVASRFLFILPTLVCAVAVAGPLEDGFRSPPSSAKPRTWWHWMDGNVTKKGITADLEAMAKAGFGGATIVDVTCSLPRGPLEFDTPDWYDTVKFAVTEAHRLGLEIDLPNCSGWSSSGGPWVTPERSMKFVEFTEMRVRGGERFRGTLPMPKETHGFYEDIAVLAFPVPKAEGGRLLPVSTELRRMNGRQTASNSVLFSSPQPFRASGLSFRIRGGLQWNEPGKIRIETPDGVGWKVAAELCFDVRRTGITDQAVRFYPFVAPVEASAFRVVFSFPPDPTSPGYAPGYDPTFEVSEIALETKMCLSELNAKSFRVRKPIRQDVAPTTEDQVVRREAILDLTSSFLPDGTLDWTAPSDGTWAILRVGFASNGEKNHPASGRGSGLECDKLDASALDLHFDAYLSKMCAFLGADLVGRGKNGFGGVLVDSYEVGSQNWTGGFERTFRERNGYDIVPFLTILSGRVVDSVAASEKVLADFRKTIADLFVENYATRLAERCHAHGLDLGVECYGNGPFDTLKYGAKVDMPMGEFWASRDPGVKNTTGVGGEANAKLMSSISHVWGKRLTGMESYTAFPQDGKWQKDPYSLKAQGDRVFARGVNRLVYHRYAHQPWTEPTYCPGMTMGHWGTHFERTCTWWDIAAKPFLTYQARVQFLLQEGESVADVLVPVTSAVPNGGGDAESTFRGWTEPPTGYDWDWCSEDDAARFASRYRIVGRTSDEIASRIAAANLPPDFVCRTSSATNALAWCHRRYRGGDEAYFVAWGDAVRGTVATCSFRQSGKAVELWDAESGEIVRAAQLREEGGRTDVTLRLKPSGSVFVFFRSHSDAEEETTGDPSFDGEVAGPWRLDIAGKTVTLAEPKDWTAFDDPDIRYFSGTATYVLDRAKADLADGCMIDFGDVRNAAEVLVDGKKVATLWRPPFRCRLPAGSNLTVRVVNLWPNRLIGDEELPENCTYGKAFLPGWGVGIREIPDWVREGLPIPNGRHTFTTWKHWHKGDALLPSGLLGPVRVSCGADDRAAPADELARQKVVVDIPSAPEGYRRPKDWKPVLYPKDLQTIARDHSEETMVRARAQMAKVEKVNATGRYRATGRSLDAHACPEWFRDAKLGVFIDWGLWSLASWCPYVKGARLYPDWYELRCRTDANTAAYHAKNWGKDFKSDHFIDLFRGERFDAPALMALFRTCGAKYVVPFLKHHSGFCLWDCSYTFRDSVDQGARRDFAREMAEACRANGLKFGFYDSQAGEWEYPILQADGTIAMYDEADPVLKPYSRGRETTCSGKVAVRDFVRDYIVPQATEFIDKYDPDIFWGDYDWMTDADRNGSYDIVAYLYNRAEGRKEVAVNDRFGNGTPEEVAGHFPKGYKWRWLRTVRGDFFTDESGDTADRIDPTKAHPWEECTGISLAYGNHWQANNPESVLSERDFVCLFADVVARGGNLLLLVNLDPQGALPDVQRTRLEQIGAWLKTYGEAIYATRPLAPYATETASYTQSKDGKAFYVIVKKPQPRLKLGFSLPSDAEIVELGSGQRLSFERKDKTAEVSIPEDLTGTGVPFVLRVIKN